jgi:hypothetical protein
MVKNLDLVGVRCGGEWYAQQQCLFGARFISAFGPEATEADTGPLGSLGAPTFSLFGCFCLVFKETRSHYADQVGPELLGLREPPASASTWTPGLASSLCGCY